MPGCELVMTCPYYNDTLYGMAEIDKERYCQGSYCWCGRYLTFKARQRELQRANSPDRQDTTGDKDGLP